MTCAYGKRGLREFLRKTILGRPKVGKRAQLIEGSASPMLIGLVRDALPEKISLIRKGSTRSNEINATQLGSSSEKKKAGLIPQQGRLRS